MPRMDDQGAALLALYDQALPQVYGYLLPRCGSAAAAEDVTSETFLAAVHAVQKGTVPTLTVAWLIGVARHKLVDHWRRTAREDRRLQRVAAEPDAGHDDPWDAQLDAVTAHATLATLGPHHRMALTLRYLDGLSVPEVARHLDRTVHATEALLVRARTAFRNAYSDPDRLEVDRGKVNPSRGLDRAAPPHNAPFPWVASSDDSAPEGGDDDG